MQTCSCRAKQPPFRALFRLFSLSRPPVPGICAIFRARHGGAAALPKIPETMRSQDLAALDARYIDALAARCLDCLRPLRPAPRRDLGPVRVADVPQAAVAALVGEDQRSPALRSLPGGFVGVAGLSGIRTCLRSAPCEPAGSSSPYHGPVYSDLRMVKDIIMRNTLPVRTSLFILKNGSANLWTFAPIASKRNRGSARASSECKTAPSETRPCWESLGCRQAR